MSLGVDIVHGTSQVPAEGTYQGSDTSAIVMYNPLQQVEIPSLPPAWITIHQSAVAASLAAGATTFAISKLSGQLVTYTITSGVYITGTVLSEGARFVAGDGAANQIQSKTSTATSLLQTVGDTCTNITSMVASATTAAVVGAGAMIGSMCYNLYQTYKPVVYQHQEGDQTGTQEQATDSFDYEFVVCDVRPLTRESSNPSENLSPS
jgi:hypothetical protein